MRSHHPRRRRQGVNKVFKGPEFVKKHLWNKHAARVLDELYLMAYLMDPDRPRDAPPVFLHRILVDMCDVK